MKPEDSPPLLMKIKNICNKVLTKDRMFYRICLIVSLLRVEFIMDKIITVNSLLEIGLSEDTYIFNLDRLPDVYDEQVYFSPEEIEEVEENAGDIIILNGFNDLVYSSRQ